MPGPLPKRSDVRRRRNITGSADHVTVTGAVVVPSVPPGWDPLARNIFKAMQESGQSAFYEPSDWAAALLAGHVTTLTLTCPGTDREWKPPKDQPEAKPTCPVCERPMRLNKGSAFYRHRRANLRAEAVRSMAELWAPLLLTEADRRRARIEIERVQSAGDRGVDRMAKYRDIGEVDGEGGPSPEEPEGA